MIAQRTDDNADEEPLLASRAVEDPVHRVHPGTCSSGGQAWFSQLLFSWVAPMLQRSRAGELQIDDTLYLPNQLSAAVLWKRFDDEGVVRSGRLSMLKALYKIFARDFWMAGLARLTTELCKIGSPMIVREIILHVEGQSNMFGEGLTGGLCLALTLLLVVVVQACTLQHFIHGVFMVGAGINTVVTAAVYDKSLRISSRSLDGPQLGQLLNFQAKDASKLREVVVFSHNLWAGPVTIAGCTALLLYVLGPSALVGVCTIPVLIPVETWVATRSQAYRKNVLKFADARVSLIGEVVDGIKTVKLNALETIFRARVENQRQSELASIRTALNLNACNQAVMRSSPIVVALATFLAYAVSGNELKAQTAFTALALFHTIAHPFHVMPKAIQLYADGKVSLQRLQTFLTEQETRREDLLEMVPTPPEVPVDPSIKIREADFRPSAVSPVCLENVTVDMRRGLSVISGPIGSGKTTLLLGLIERQQQEQDKGALKIMTSDRRIALCPDSPWIINASARYNICLGSLTEFDQDRFDACVQACALGPDFAEWPKGEDTTIGAKGITISGGQMARIALARAMYAQCDVVVLDNPLAALDVAVGRWTYIHAVCKMAEKAAVIMSTHQPQYMKGNCIHFLIEDNTLRDMGQGNLRKEKQEFESPVQQSKSGSCTESSASASAGSSGTVKIYQPPLDSSSRESKGNKAMENLAARINVDLIKGGVSASVYTGYLKACGAAAVFFVVSISVLAQVVDVSTGVILAKWSDDPSAKNGYYLAWYSAVCMFVVMANGLRFVVMCWLGLRGSKTLHEALLTKVMGAPLPFFYITESGRITSRFSSDFDTIDMIIPTTLASFVDALLTMLAAVAVVAGTSPAFMFFVIPIAMAYHWIQAKYRGAAKELKRLDSATKSPIYSHHHETMDGLLSIQAYGIQAKMRALNFELIDTNTRARINWDATNRWLGIRLDLLGAAVVFVAALMAVVAGSTTPGMVGLGLSYALTITRTLSFGVRSSTAMENQFNAVERVQEFSSLPQEETTMMERANDYSGTQWPREKIEVCDVFARHRSELPPVLKGVSFSVRCGEQVGVCGRTGSGKSSLALALVRALDCFEGQIMVDGCDIKTIPLSRLRSGVAIISQDAHVFSGTIRSVIDAHGTCSDAQVWDLCEKVGLKPSLAGQPAGLDTKVTNGGDNWSAGQRQLFCIARAMVNRPGVLVFDEATANVDPDTNETVRHVIQSQFNEAAVLVIAHRLEDVTSCHRVIVMESGVIAEEGEPAVLLQNQGGMLSQLAQDLGPEIAEKLRIESYKP